MIVCEFFHGFKMLRVWFVALHTYVNIHVINVIKYLAEGLIWATHELVDINHSNFAGMKFAILSHMPV